MAYLDDVVRLSRHKPSSGHQTSLTSDTDDVTVDVTRLIWGDTIAIYESTCVIIGVAVNDKLVQLIRRKSTSLYGKIVSHDQGLISY